MKNSDGLPMHERENVPLAAGVDAAHPDTTVHDKAIPRHVTTADGRKFNLRESHDYHERVEHPLMQAGLSYEDAHRYATEAEHARMRHHGFDPNEIEQLAAPHIDMALHRSRAMGYRAHPTVDNQPYVDDGKTETLNRGQPEEDERVVYDHMGNAMMQPQQHRALGKVDFITAFREGKYHGIEPTTAHVWATGRTRDAVERKLNTKVRKMGTDGVRRMIDAMPPMSQQQLQERHGGH